MKLAYESPQLFCDEYVADTMISSATAYTAAGAMMCMPNGGPKNDNADNNHNCWACDSEAGVVMDNENACLAGNLYDTTKPGNACP